MMKKVMPMTLFLSLLLVGILSASDMEEKEKLPKKKEQVQFNLRDIKYFAELDQKIISSKEVSHLLWIALKLSSESVPKEEPGNY